MGEQLTHFRVAGHFHAAHFSHELGLLPAIKQLGADAQLLGSRLGAAVSEAKRSASALKASSCLRRLSGLVLRLFVLMTQEIYVLLLCA